MSRGDPETAPLEVGQYGPLHGKYAIHNTIGAGGFAKVKSATHLITGEKVAIKIMDKNLLGADLHRVQTEIAALRELVHQHICRLVEIIDTEQKIYLVLEYCSGGELFDYIVRKDRLSEPEARHFFRQIISAIAFVHSRGFAHRDLKPENLLLSSDLQLKLIDFGLCAKPEGGNLGVPLETCCGSPAYAAPELIAGSAYLGNEADIWSMGILLYALLCGFLPFEDDNLRVMYQKIQSGIYEEPVWLSDESKALLRRMLCVDPKRRITVQELLTDPFVEGNYSQPIKWRSIYDLSVLDSDCIRELAKHYSTDDGSIRKRIALWEYDHFCATYCILLHCCKRRNKPLSLTQNEPKPTQSTAPFNLPPPPQYPAPATPTRLTLADQKAVIQVTSPLALSVLNSPTIHASLECGLDQPAIVTKPLPLKVAPLGVIKWADAEEEESEEEKYVDSVEDTPQHQRLPTLPLTQIEEEDKENIPAAAVTQTPVNTGANKKRRPIRKRTPPKPNGGPKPNENGGKHWSETKRGQSVQATPATRRVTATLAPTTPGLYATPQNGGVKVRTPRSKTRGDHDRHKMFHSLERGLDRVIKAITPRKKPDSVRSSPRFIENVANVSTVSTHDPWILLTALLQICNSKGIVARTKEWTVRGTYYEQGTRVERLYIELEVVYVRCAGNIILGVKRKRLRGDAMRYKRICEDILQLAD